MSERVMGGGSGEEKDGLR